jgi:hypothetical protein
MADRILAQNVAPVWTPPPEGDFSAVCVDIIDLGMVETAKWGPKWKIAILFQINCVNEETGRVYELAERFTNSMNEKSALRKFLGQWRGRPYSEAEATTGIALDKLVGQKAVVTVVHNQVGDRTYANVFAIRRLGPSDAPMAPEHYERSPRWAEKRQDAAGGKVSPPATNQPVARDQGRPAPSAQRAHGSSAGPGLDREAPHPGDLRDDEQEMPIDDVADDYTPF